VRSRKWAELERARELAAILVELRWVLERKCKRLGINLGWFDRGTPSTQLVHTSGKTFFFVMEAGYRGTLYPRVVYRGEDIGVSSATPDHLAAARAALQTERKKVNLNRIVAFRDPREAVSLTWDEARFVQYFERRTEVP
jgi:hypothetical protein